MRHSNPQIRWNQIQWEFAKAEYRQLLEHSGLAEDAIEWPCGCDTVSEMQERVRFLKERAEAAHERP